MNGSPTENARFFNHYSKLLPGILNENEVNCESYLKESSLLFWTIIATGSRRLEHATKLHRIAVQHIRGGTFQPLLHITNPIPIIKSSLILCLWPLPVDTMWKDPFTCVCRHSPFSRCSEWAFRQRSRARLCKDAYFFVQRDQRY